MTSYESIYRAGQIVAEIERQSGERLSHGAMNNCSSLPSRLAVILRHVWDKVCGVPAVAALLQDWTPQQPTRGEELGGFWLGYYHQRAVKHG